MNMRMWNIRKTSDIPDLNMFKQTYLNPPGLKMLLSHSHIIPCKIQRAEPFPMPFIEKISQTAPIIVIILIASIIHFLSHLLPVLILSTDLT
jgi:hypothetical protein